MNNKPSCLLALLGGSVGIAAYAQTFSSAAETRSAIAQSSVFPSDAEVRRILIDRIDRQRTSVGMVVGIITPGGRHIVSYGQLNQDDRRPLDGDTIFEIASVTKVFTSLLLADMSQRGEVALSDPVARFLPANVKVPERNGRAITLADLATHTSGLPSMPTDAPQLVNPAVSGYSLGQLFHFLSGYALPRDTGSQWEYSNLGGALLGYALARRAGTDYEDLVHVRITGPLGMTSTGTAVSPQQKPLLAVGHNADLEALPHLEMPAFAPAASIVSSANDLLTLLSAFLGDTKSPLASAMAKMLETRRPAPQIGGEQALGWYLEGKGDDQIVVHDGLILTFASSVAWDPRQGVGVVVLSNAGVMVQDISRHLLRPNLPLTNVPQEITLDSAALEGYTGRYQPGPGTVFTVTHEGTGLAVQVPQLPKMRLHAESELNFFTREFGLRFIFQRNGQGRVTGLVLHSGGGRPEVAAARAETNPGNQ